MDPAPARAADAGGDAVSAAQQMDMWTRFHQDLELPPEPAEEDEDDEPGSERRLAFAPSPQRPPRYRLTIEQTKGEAGRELCRRAKTDPELAAAIVAANERFIYGVCWPYIRPRRHLEHDIVQEGRLGFLYALVRKFEPDRGIELITYATSWVKHKVQRWLRDEGLIRVPVYAAEAADRAARQGAASAEDAAEISDARYIKEAWAMRSGLRSLDTPFSTRDERAGSTLGDTIADDAPLPDDHLRAAELREVLDDVMRELTPVQRRVLTQRFLTPGASGEKTLKEIGDQINRSRERVRQIETDALARLRRLLELRGVSPADLGLR